MRRNLSVIWMVAQREFTDQFRDWRIVVPMVLLVTLFPFIADDTTRQAVSFMNRFGGDLILDNLIPSCAGDRLFPRLSWLHQSFVAKKRARLNRSGVLH
jgi:hypothetical protein